MTPHDTRLTPNVTGKIPTVKGATLATTSSRALLSACRAAGIDVAEVLAAANLTAAQVDDPDGRLPGEAVTTLWRAALARSPDPALSLDAAVAVPFGAYRVIDFLAASAATVGEGLRRVARYFPLINSVVELHIHEDKHEIRVEILNPTDPAGLPQPYAEYALAVTVLHCRRAFGVDWPLVAVDFTYSAPGSIAVHERVFGCPVRFGKPRTELVIARSVWDQPNRVASSDLLRTLEEHADRLLATLRSAEVVESGVARLLMEELRGGDPSLPNIAKRMGLSPRTLQRRLRLERSSFADVLDSTRKHFASCYMQERNLQLTEIAYLLGFSEQSAFTRAFHRWYGVSPTEFRSKSACG